MVEYRSIIKQNGPMIRKQERPIIRQDQGHSLYKHVKSDLDRRFKRR